MKWRHSHHGITDDEKIARYAHVLGNVPAAVADRAYAAAFERLSPAQREEIMSGLRSQLGDSPDPAAAVPETFATLMRDLRARHAVVTAPGAAALAAAFVDSPPIVAYFTTGAGSVSIDQQPPWLHELAGHETAPIDAGRIDHNRGPHFRI
ncbi:hypothetical protein [Microbacterium sp. BK668]|uniref:hypothetical protein n=1 Tax=Microbacterium sp. BK668 TaxID=2512118 RepID=UPI00105C5237|nr:hypothetical protein [Microbacterium sp. BK668]TDN90931.1 hypothetical protein EV279_0424 [Microbacterium sp. BK668]